MIETTAKVQETESQRAAASARLAELNASADALSDSLESRRAVIADVLAVLAAHGRNPPPAILVRPGDMVEAVRAAMMLGATMPDLKGETDALARDLDKLDRRCAPRSPSSATIWRGAPRRSRSTRPG